MLLRNILAGPFFRHSFSFAFENGGCSTKQGHPFDSSTAPSEWYLRLPVGWNQIAKTDASRIAAQCPKW
jgi:hypothetical protein